MICIPTDVVGQILEYLRAQEVNWVKLVCRRWYEMVQKSLKTLYICKNPGSWIFLNCFENLKSIYFSEALHVALQPLEILGNIKDLFSMKLSLYEPLTTGHYEVFSSITQLRHLQLGLKPIPKENQRIYQREILSRLICLENLTLDCDSGFEAEFLTKLSNLTKVCLNFGIFSSFSLEGFSNIRKLRSFSLRSNSISQSDIKVIAQATQLRTLLVFRQDPNQVHIGSLRTLTALNHMELCINAINYRMLSSLPSLQYLLCDCIEPRTTQSVWSSFDGDCLEFSLSPNLQSLALKNVPSDLSPLRVLSVMTTLTALTIASKYSIRDDIVARSLSTVLSN